MVDSDHTPGLHPDAATLRSFAQGLLGPAEAVALERHLSDCDSCCRELEATPLDSFVGRLRAAEQFATPNTLAYHARLDESDASGTLGDLADHPRYRVIRLLGRGGMGAVYLAEHRRMGRLVALKVINPELLNHFGALLRFQQEVRAAAKLDHPNIVAAYDADQASDRHFLVMEHVEGQNLADYLAANGPLSVAQACDIVRQAALGLQHAHECGMVHRDIKPHNLMLTPAGQVKVLDFGMARFATDAAGEAAPPAGASLSHQTGIGVVMGTADYIAPEQARDSHRADGRSDIYSLGCAFYHLLAGEAPFPGGTVQEKLRRHAEVAPSPLRDLRRDVPERLAQIIATMMARNPQDRYASAAQVDAALREFTPRTHRARRTRQLAWIAAVMILVGLIAFALQRFAARDNELAKADARKVAVLSLDGVGEIRRWQAHRLGEVRRIVIAADGRTGWSVGNDLRQWDLASGALVQNVTPWHLTWFYVQAQTVPAGAVAPTNSTTPSVVMPPRPNGISLEQVANAHWHEEFLPTADGTQVLTTDGQVGFLRLHESKTLQQVRVLGPGPTRYWQAAWFRDGRRVLTGGDDGTARIWCLSKGEIVAEIKSLATRVTCVDVSPDDAKLLIASAADGIVRVLDASSGREDFTVADQIGDPASARFVRDGRGLLTCGRDGSIRFVDVSTGQVNRIYRAPNRTVRWARLAMLHGGERFASLTADGNLRLWDMEATQPLFSAPFEATATAFAVTPDGRQALMGTDSGAIIQWRLPELTKANTALRELMQ